MRLCAQEINQIKESKFIQKRLMSNKPLYDPNLSKMKKKEYERKQRNIKYDDDPQPKKTSITNFFKKK